MLHAPNVLLLDQDDLLRKATALLLTERGAAVSSTATLEEAISRSQQRVHDVALIDISRTTPSAGEILRVRQAGLLPSRIVLSTDEPLSREEVEDFSEVLVKPYPFDQLVAAIFEGACWAARELPRWIRPPRRAARARLRLG